MGSGFSAPNCCRSSVGQSYQFPYLRRFTNFLVSCYRLLKLKLSFSLLFFSSFVRETSPENEFCGGK